MTQELAQGREEEDGVDFETLLDDCFDDVAASGSYSVAAAPAAASDEKPVPDGLELKYEALLQLGPTELRNMLKEMNAPSMGNKQDMAVRLVRALAGHPPLAADAAAFEAIEADEAAKMARVLRKAVREAQGKGAGRGRGRAPRAGSRESGAPVRRGPRKFKVISDRKVGVLHHPDVTQTAIRYLEPGQQFEVAEEHVNPDDGRRFYRLKVPRGQAGKGWIPECSRKDASRRIIEEIEEELPAPAVALEDEPAEAADDGEGGEADGEEGSEPPRKLRRLDEEPAANGREDEEQQKRGRGKGRGRGRGRQLQPVEPQAEAEDEEAEGEVARVEPEKTPAPEELPEGWLPPGREGKYAAMVKMSPAELRSMLQQAEAPLDGARYLLAVRLIRQLDGLAPTEADARMFEARRKRVALEAAGNGRSLLKLSRVEFLAAIEEFIEGADLQSTKLGDLNRFLEEKFGELPMQALLKAREMATRSIVRRSRLQQTMEEMIRKAHDAMANTGASNAGKRKQPKDSIVYYSGSGVTDDEAEEAAPDAGHGDIVVE